MLRATHRKWTGILALGAMFFALAGNSSAQPKKSSEKHDAMALNHTLRDVINAGAKLYNDEGDHVGCYRLYQGSLLTVRPFVAPDLQKAIDAGLAKAEKMGTFAERAFELRRVLDDLRAKTGTGEEKKNENKQKDEKGKTVRGGSGQVAGKVFFDGRPLAPDYAVVLVTDKAEFRAAIDKDGSFKIAQPIAVGDYAVFIFSESVTTTLPGRYGSPKTTPLRIRVQAGQQNVELNLVK